MFKLFPMLMAFFSAIVIHGQQLMVEGSPSDDGIFVDEAGLLGLHIHKSGGNGIFIDRPGFMGIRIDSSDSFSFYTKDAMNTGLVVENPSGAGVYIEDSGSYGTIINRSGVDGLQIHTTAGHGISVYNVTENAMDMHTAKTGINMSGISEYGVDIFSPGFHGVRVINAGIDGLHIENASDDGVEINNGNYGVYARNQSNYGVWSNNSGIHGVYVTGSGANAGRFTNSSSSAVPSLYVAHGDDAKHDIGLEGVGRIIADKDVIVRLNGLNASFKKFEVEDNSGNRAFTVYENGDAVVELGLSVLGNLSKGSGTFKIDHPLDPKNKYLYHSFVESPDMMNIYNGNIITDEVGLATVVLPAYFDALNREFRYQLTVIGTFAQAIIKEEIQENTFIIQTSEPNVKVSWQVTGVRKDPYAEANRVQVEVEKEEENKGSYLHPAVYENHMQQIELSN